MDEKDYFIRKYSKGVNNIEVGSIVIFIDGSYTMSLLPGGKLEHTYLGLSTDFFEVLEINVPNLPTNVGLVDILGYQNNCIVKNIIDDSIHYCNGLNITPSEIPQELEIIIERNNTINTILNNDQNYLIKE